MVVHCEQKLKRRVEGRAMVSGETVGAGVGVQQGSWKNDERWG
jgi:hypothetical protein